MTVHKLKTWSEYFELMLLGLKKFEIRRNDRDFKSGDILILKEFDPILNTCSGRQIKCKVSSLLNDPLFVKDGFVVMSIETEESFPNIIYLKEEM